MLPEEFVKKSGLPVQLYEVANEMYMKDFYGKFNNNTDFCKKLRSTPMMLRDLIKRYFELQNQQTMTAREKVLLCQMQVIAEVSGTSMGHLELDKIILSLFQTIPIFAWLVRKGGTSLFIPNQGASQNLISEFERDWGETLHATYFIYDGNQLKQVYKEQAINFVNFGEL